MVWFPQSAEHVPSSYSEPGFFVNGLLVLLLLLAGGLVVGELIGGVKDGQSDWEVNGGRGEVVVVFVLRLHGLLGTRDTDGLLGAGDIGKLGNGVLFSLAAFSKL